MTEERHNRWQYINKDTGEKTWLTPRRIIEALGHFDTDPCCPDVMPWRTADRMITKAEDGLKTPWSGRVWLNPPYGREAIPFLEKMSKYDGGGGIVCIFARTDTDAWQRLVFPFADSILFLKGRLRFCRADGTDGDCATAPSALIAYSPADTEALERSGIQGFLVKLKNVKTDHEGNS